MQALKSGTTFGGYRVEAVAGQGGMGVVYRAVELSLERTVALKLIMPELARDRDFRERFQRESRITASIDHVNVIADAGAVRGWVIGSINLTMRRLAEGHFEHVGNKVGFNLVMFAEFLAGAGRIEIAEGDEFEAVNRLIPVEHSLEH